MKQCRFLFLPALMSILLLSCPAAYAQKHKPANPKTNAPAYVYEIPNRALYDTIVRLDSLFFQAYNTCDRNLEAYAAFFSDSIEFYHDGGGLMTSKPGLVEATKKFICGKVTRELVKGSIEVYPIKNYGAVEMGLHQFYNSTEKYHVPQVGRFVIVWQRRPEGWKIRRVISLH